MGAGKRGQSQRETHPRKMEACHDDPLGAVFCRLVGIDSPKTQQFKNEGARRALGGCLAPSFQRPCVPGDEKRIKARKHPKIGHVPLATASEHWIHGVHAWRMVAGMLIYVFVTSDPALMTSGCQPTAATAELSTSCPHSRPVSDRRRVRPALSSVIHMIS